MDSTPTAGAWTTATNAPVRSISPDSIDKLENSEAFKAFCELAQIEFDKLTESILDPRTSDEIATRKRHARKIAEDFLPQKLLSLLRNKHPRK